MSGEICIRRMKNYCLGVLQSDIVLNDMFNFFTDETQEKSLRPETVEMMYNTLLQFTNGISYFVLVCTYTGLFLNHNKNFTALIQQISYFDYRFLDSFL